MTNCYYFGVMKHAGHFLYCGNHTIHERYLPEDFPVNVRALDGALLPPQLPQDEGRAELIHLNGWTVLTFWDRSADRRGRSSSTFIILGVVDFSEAVSIAKEYYPQVWSRFTFEVFERKTAINEALGL